MDLGGGAGVGWSSVDAVKRAKHQQLCRRTTNAVTTTSSRRTKDRIVSSSLAFGGRGLPVFPGEASRWSLGIV